MTNRKNIVSLLHCFIVRKHELKRIRNELTRIVGAHHDAPAYWYELSSIGKIPNYNQPAGGQIQNKAKKKDKREMSYLEFWKLEFVICL